MWYLCGLGSNISPERNLSRALALLVDVTSWLWVSRVLRSDPVGMESENSFLNALVIFWSDLDPEQLKARLNDMEERMGRGRDDPERKLKDHAIDIDILEFHHVPSFDGQPITEPYFRKLFEDRFSPNDEFGSITFEGHEFGSVPATIFVAPSKTAKVVVKASTSSITGA